MHPLTKIQIGMSEGTSRDFLHRETRADHGVLRQIFQNKDYSIEKLSRGKELINTYHAIRQAQKVPLIIDAGANIGASAVYFSIAYPNAHTVCFEPETSNFKILAANTNGLNIELHEAAVGSSEGAVDVFDPGNGEWGGIKPAPIQMAL